MFYRHCFCLRMCCQVGLELNGTLQLLVYSDEDNLLGDSINTKKENTKTLLEARRDVGL
jgi:hypothetical protein